MKAFAIAVAAAALGAIAAGFLMRTVGGMFARKPAAAGPAT